MTHPNQMMILKRYFAQVQDVHLGDLGEDKLVKVVNLHIKIIRVDANLKEFIYALHVKVNAKHLAQTLHFAFARTVNLHQILHKF